jgi:hypothetical protein
LPLQINKITFAHADTAEKGFLLALDDIAKFMDAGKEKGYLTYNEVK